MTITLTMWCYFNSHPHEEDDIAINATTAAITNFNSHPHEEDDIIHRPNTSTRSYFNSHPHEEDDRKDFKNRAIIDISTHILTKRMTGIHHGIVLCDDISTHILTKRMTRKLSCAECCYLFQLTSSRRGWQNVIADSKQV